MNQKLPIENELSVKYILNELDPSEETMMEEAMLNDQDLLIEVESMRRTLRRCEELPEFEAPQLLLDGVMEEVASYQAGRNQVVRLRSLRNFSYAAAATVLIAGGTAWYIQGGGTKGVNTANQSALMETTVDAGFADPAQTPWIDRRDILHVSSLGAIPGSITDSMAVKLRLIDAPANPRSNVRQIQLTGSQN